MVEIESKEQEKIVGYPEEIKDNAVAKKVWDCLRYGSFSRSVLKNKVNELAFKEYFKNQDLDRVIDEMIRKKVIREKPKEVTTKVISSKSEQNNEEATHK